MRSAIPAQGPPAGNALIAAFSCGNHTQKTAVRVASSFARPVFPSIERSIQKVSQLPTRKIGSKRAPNDLIRHSVPQKNRSGGSAAEPENSRSSLLNWTGDRGEGVIGVRSNQPDCPDDNNKNDSEHHGIFGNVLTAFARPQARNESGHTHLQVSLK